MSDRKRYRIVNEIIRHKTLFSTNIMKRDAVVLIEYSDMTIQVVENKSEIDAEKSIFLYPLSIGL